jgi:MscS family membrane protein
MRVVDVLADRVMTRLDPRERAVSYSVAPLLVRFVKICIFCFAILFVLTAWGYNTTTILAGVGVGGLAVALAAQKTIENLFGGIALISDRPVLVGDLCQFGGQLGTVEDIGLRSTRIRTLDRTLVTIPNSQFSTMTLENYSKRDRMWFHPALHLHRYS